MLDKSVTINDKSLCVISDFDGTITMNGSSSLGCFRKIFGNDYINDIIKIREEIKKYDYLNSYDKTKLYHKMELSLLSSYLKKNYNLSSIPSLFEIRCGYDYFLNFLSRNNIPLVISSSGVGNIIELVLKYYGLDYYTIICSNYYDEKYNFDLDNVIFSQRKYNDELLEFTCNYNKIIIGNEISDSNMVPYKDKNDIFCLFGEEPNNGTIFDYQYPKNGNMCLVLENIK